MSTNVRPLYDILQGITNAYRSKLELKNAYTIAKEIFPNNEIIKYWRNLEKQKHGFPIELYSYFNSQYFQGKIYREYDFLDIEKVKNDIKAGIVNPDYKFPIAKKVWIYPKD